MELVRRTPRYLLMMLLLGASGCMWWHNVSTYFNTVYLANQHIEMYEAEQRAVAPPNPNGAIAVLHHRWLDEEYFIRQRQLSEGQATPITPSFSESLGATKEVHNVHLDSAIILGSKVLADKKGTKYLEDALFIVGKAEFYKNDFTGAERKFLELLSHYPNTKYGADVQIFLARSMLLNHDLDTASLTLQRGLKMSEETGDKATISNVHRALAELIYARNPDSLSAIASELHQAETGLSGEDLARLAYEEGAVDYLNGDWPRAERAFQTTYENAKGDWLSGEGHVAHALALREHGDLDAARTELQFVIDHVKFSASFPPARFELAYTDEQIARKAVGGNLRSPEFADRYHGPLHAEYFSLDTMYKNSSALIISRAKFRQAEMFREMGLYDSAASTAASLVGTKDFSSMAMNEYVSGVASSLVSFARWRKELDRLDSLTAELNRPHPPPGRASSVYGESQEVAIHLKAMREALGPRWNPARPVPMTKQDSTTMRFIEARLKAQAPAELVIKDTAQFIDSLHGVMADAHFELGHAYETFGEIPEARTEYRIALSMDTSASMDTAKTALRAQTLYAWLQLEHQQKNQVVFDSLLHELLTRYGQTIYAGEARILFESSMRNSPGELAYSQAYQSLKDHGLDVAKPALLHVAIAFPQEDVAPRSLYAIGESYEEVERYDSSLVYYRRVLTEYPYSAYALALRPRLADASTPGVPHAPLRNINPLLRRGVPENESMQPEPRNVHQSPGPPPGSPGQPPPQPNFPQLPPGVQRPPLPPGLRIPSLPPGAPVPPNFQPPQQDSIGHHG
ncbi:MAG TPA: tetratricopeptide repeat protein [Candidatus Kapabacteria bacterium]|nr:tetratricopeptide repeat protein [Candidatus Kapabacteria bacterium]